MFKRLLVPVDGTDMSERAMTQSVALGRQLDAAIVGYVVEALPPLPTTGAALNTYPREVAEHEARSAAHAQQVLARFGEMAAAQGVPFEAHHELSDDIAGAIARAAEARDCDMIVMATHGRGIFGELLFGSQSKNVMARSKRPLLVLH